MPHLSRFTLLFVLVGSLLWLHDLSAYAPLATFTQRVSLRSNGNQGNDNSNTPDISADGRYIAFASDASNLVSGDNNDARDIFVHDRQTGTTKRVSVDSDGDEANFDSDSPSISDDGRYVAFHTFATNLRNGDTNGVPDIYVHDRQSGKTKLVNIVLNGQTNDVSYNPQISGDGKYITFWSFATNLVGDDTNNVADVFRFDRVGETMFRVSLDSNGVQSNGHSRYPTISENGRYIAFESDANNLDLGDTGFYRDIFWHDMNTGETRRVSLHSNGSEASGDSFESAISANGRYVVFTSLANNLTSNDDNVRRDVFIRNTENDNTERITDVMGNIDTWELPSVSSTGRYVAFRGRPAPEPPNQDCQGVLCEIFVYDRQSHSTVRASVSSSGSAANDDSFMVAMAADGRYLAFSSTASNLVANDTNNDRDIFVREFLPPPTLGINFTTGKPGSSFALSGRYYLANQTAQVWVNGRLLGNVSADSSGDLTFRLQSQTNTDSGAYYVFVKAGTYTTHSAFYLHNSFPTRADTGNGPAIALPDGIAFTHTQFLPLVAR